ncbi:MAG: hypothetical protein O7A04_12325 [Acidobacteria bacterium]|nr:hypothetical protein [Acidobacteriota bacterium]
MGPAEIQNLIADAVASEVRKKLPDKPPKRFPIYHVDTGEGPPTSADGLVWASDVKEWCAVKGEDGEPLWVRTRAEVREKPEQEKPEPQKPAPRKVGRPRKSAPPDPPEK